MASEEVWSEAAIPSQPASAMRVVTSSLFSYSFVAISAYLTTRAKAELVAGAEQGLVFNLVHIIAWFMCRPIPCNKATNDSRQ